MFIKKIRVKGKDGTDYGWHYYIYRSIRKGDKITSRCLGKTTKEQYEDHLKRRQESLKKYQ